MKSRTGRLMGLLILLIVVGLLSLGVGSVRLSPAEISNALLDSTPSESWPPSTRIIRELRLPRILLGGLVGLALGAAGAAYQGLFRNPLADPYVIGASAGSALGATLVMVAGGAGALGFGAVPLGGFLGAMAAASLVYLTTTWWGPAPIVSMLLAGSAVSSFLGAVVWLLMVLHDEDLARIVLWMMGSLAGRGWSAVIGGGAYTAVGFLGLCALARPLDALSLGEQPAQALGLPLKPFSGLIVAAASLATAAAVAVAGVIGFVGLIAPHLARALVGARHRYLIPASGLAGAILLVLADDLARTVVAPIELPVGVLTAILGGPFFLVVLRRSLR